VALAGAVGGVGLAIWLQSILQALMVFYSLLVVMLFVPLLAGLYSSRPKAAGALASMVVSAPVTVVFYVATGGAGVGILNPAALGILVSGLVLVLFSVPAAGKTSV
jgi:SSS family solute:Na+ symporter